MLELDEPTTRSWEQFLERDTRAPRGVLGDCWERSRAYGVAADGPAPAEGVSTQDLKDRRDHLAERYGGLSLFQGFAATVSTSGLVAVMSDAEGVIVRAEGLADAASAPVRARLVEGAQWSERVRGTNAIGTALHEGQPVAVIGRAHFEARNHGLVCYAAPVRDAFGALCGVLDVSGDVQRAHPLMGAVVQGAARLIELAVKDRAWESAFPGGLKALEARLAGEHALLVEFGGRLRFASASALHRLNAPSPLGDDATKLLGVTWEELQEAALRGQTLVRSALRFVPQPLFVGRGRHVLGCTVRLESLRGYARPMPLPAAFEPLFGHDGQVARTKERAARAAKSLLPVLLLAETGTGKELLARAIHETSRRTGRFLTVNCGAFSEQLLESELFGHAPHAFTGASPRGAAGKLESADGGTLFLDEVAEMSPRLQAMLLRVLEDGSFTRVGDSEDRRSSFRLICATCRDLRAMVAAGTFRSDLYFRLRGVELGLPPLRERTDRVELAEHLLDVLAAQLEVPRPELAADALRAIEVADWPGNVRELKTALHHALVMGEGASQLSAEHLPEQSIAPVAPAPVQSRRDLEADAVRVALAQANGNVSEAARQLGVARSTLYRMMRRTDNA